MSNFLKTSLFSNKKFDLSKSEIYVSNTGFLCLKGRDARNQSKLSLGNIADLDWTDDYVRPLVKLDATDHANLSRQLQSYVQNGMDFCYRWSFIPVIKYFGLKKLIEELGEDGFFLIDKINVVVLTDDKLQNDNWEIEYKALQENVPALLDSSIQVIDKLSTNPFNESSRRLGSFQHDTTRTFSLRNWGSAWKAHHYQYLTKGSLEGQGDVFDISEKIRVEPDSQGFNLIFPERMDLISSDELEISGSLSRNLNSVVRISSVKIDDRLASLVDASPGNENPVVRYAFDQWKELGNLNSYKGSGNILLTYKDSLLGTRTKYLSVNFSNKVLSPLFRPPPYLEFGLGALVGLILFITFRKFYYLPRYEMCRIYGPDGVYSVKRGLKKWKRKTTHHLLLHFLEDGAISNTISTRDNRIKKIVGSKGSGAFTNPEIENAIWVITSKKKIKRPKDIDGFASRVYRKGQSIDSVEFKRIAFKQMEVDHLRNLFLENICDHHRKLRRFVMVIFRPKISSGPVSLIWNNGGRDFLIQLKTFEANSTDTINAEKSYLSLGLNGNRPKYISYFLNGFYHVTLLEDGAINQYRIIYKSIKEYMPSKKVTSYEPSVSGGIKLKELTTFATKYIYLVVDGIMLDKWRKEAYLLYDPFDFRKSSPVKNWLSNASRLYRFLSGHLQRSNFEIRDEQLEIEFNAPPLDYDYMLMFADRPEAMKEFLQKRKEDESIKKTDSVFPDGKNFKITRPSALNLRINQYQIELVKYTAFDKLNQSKNQ